MLCYQDRVILGEVSNAVSCTPRTFLDTECRVLRISESQKLVRDKINLGADSLSKHWYQHGNSNFHVSKHVTYGSRDNPNAFQRTRSSFFNRKDLSDYLVLSFLDCYLESSNIPPSSKSISPDQHLSSSTTPANPFINLRICCKMN